MKIYGIKQRINVPKEHYFRNFQKIFHEYEINNCQYLEQILNAKDSVRSGQNIVDNNLQIL